MNNYKNFEVKDWVEDPNFRKWVYAGEFNDFWASFSTDTPAQAENMEQARRILLDVRGELDPVSERELASRRSMLIDDISEKELRYLWWRSRWLQAAAVVLVTLGIGNFFWKKYNSEENRYNQILAHSKEVPIIEVINTEEKIKLVTLPDGSSVILKKNARISYPKIFSANEREVAMLGEVFFEVMKETGHPFYIHSGEMMAKVTGTSFSIKANIADDQVSLLVKTGSVEVGIWDGKKNIEEHASRKTLQANQLATLDEKSGALQTSDAAGATLLDLPIESQNFTFKKTPVKEVFKILELAYGIKISFDEQVTSSCNITAHLSDEPVREKLELICEVLNAKFEMKDNAVLILSEGCGH